VVKELFRRREKFMKRILKYTFLRFADHIPNFVYRTLVPREVISFFYHLVAEKAVPHAQYLFPHRPVEMFEQDLIYVKKSSRLFLTKNSPARSLRQTAFHPRRRFSPSTMAFLNVLQRPGPYY